MTGQERRTQTREEALTREESQHVRARQQSRANMLAVVLMALAVLFFAITVVKVGGWL
ncbi:hypothetical protein [Novosphingopyxis sp.]|uniref:hypothetical protein n=1 Tax=Novosphingopyxis sp. TaxID=2709690 RepID=UPI003B599BC8